MGGREGGRRISTRRATFGFSLFLGRAKTSRRIKRLRAYRHRTVLGSDALQGRTLERAWRGASALPDSDMTLRLRGLCGFVLCGMDVAGGRWPVIPTRDKSAHWRHYMIQTSMENLAAEEEEGMGRLPNTVLSGRNSDAITLPEALTPVNTSAGLETAR